MQEEHQEEVLGFALFYETLGCSAKLKETTRGAI